MYLSEEKKSVVRFIDFLRSRLKTPISDSLSWDFGTAVFLCSKGPEYKGMC